jgi:hypothetical protein
LFEPIGRFIGVSEQREQKEKENHALTMHCTVSDGQWRVS